jgi:anthranilate synthase/aminodeoxychorismate synthase-like glutamine amidotransferase
MLLVIDNYDSFVFNLARYFQRLGQVTRTARNDALSPAQVLELKPAAIVLSPGPCSPTEAGFSLEIVRQCGPHIPILGVCLGHQTIGAAYGAQIVRASEPMHGRTSLITHANTALFARLPNPLRVCRYHSLAIEPSTMPSCLQATAWTNDGTIMAVEHRELPLVGVQFHPEAILTEAGYTLLANFLRIAGLEVTEPLPSWADERVSPSASAYTPPLQPVTF